MAFAEDLAPFVNEFADDATLGGVAVRGIFDVDSAMHGMGQGGSGIMADTPSFLLRETDVPGAIFGVTLVLGAASYTVREALPEGVGFVRLFLSKA